MALNVCVLQGRIPTSEKFLFAISNEDDAKRAVFRGIISVQRSYKKPEDQYYPEDLLLFKAFGTTAQFINNYINRGDNILLQCEVRKDDDYEKNGETIRGQIYLHVVPGGVQWQKGNEKIDKSSNVTTNKAKPSANPLSKASSGISNPLKRKSII